MAAAFLTRNKIPRPFGNILCLLLAPVFGLILYFFRDPHREVPTQDSDHLILSPADGTVMDIRVMDEPLYLKGPALRISIFMSLLDVHVNRSPVAGRVEFVRHVPGKFLQAFRSEASDVNEHNLLGIRMERDGASQGRVLVKQIAGILARRCVCYAHVGEQLERGQRFGLIRFSSRVDLFLPPQVRSRVVVGDHVTGGCSVLAEWQPEEEHS